MVLRRYTPPTCTLEVTAKTSLLSRWTGKPVLKDLEFTLHFDDPRLLKEEHLMLQGDRSQLEALQEAVTVYIQSFLSQSLSELNRAFLKSEITPAPLPSLTPAPSDQAVETSAPPEVAVNETDTNNPYTPPEVFSPVTGFHYNPAGIYLQPGTQLDHTLFLGSLATPETGETLSLTVLQLFDLATALDECLMDVVALPSLHHDTPAPTPAWVRNVAILLVTIGVSAGTLHLLNQQPEPVTETASTDRNPEETIQLSPLPSAVTPTTPTPLTSPPPAIPPNPNFPTADISPQPVIIPAPVEVPAPIFPPGTPQAPPPIAAPRDQNTLVIIPEPAPAPPPSTIASGPVAPAPRPIAPIAPPPGPPVDAGTPFGVQPSAPNIGAGVIELPPLADAESGNLERELETLSRSPVESERQALGMGESPTEENRTLFDVIPQVTEVRDYFEQNWQPPAELTETLQYRLVLNPDGSIGQIIPIGKASGDYIDRTEMPLIGEPFVSEVPDGSSPNIRVVLRPSGRVQTFLESR